VNNPGLEAEGGRAHIAYIDFPAFYAEAVGSLSAARELYESLSYTGSERHRTAKIMLHQVARMVWLADQVDAVARGRPALQIMFYMIAAEAVAKLGTGYDGDGESRKHVHVFFTRFLTAEQRNRMLRALEWAQPRPPSSPDELVDHLYGVRCDVVHEGRYFDMTVPDDACVRAVRSVFLEGAVGAARDVAMNGVRGLTPAENQLRTRRRRWLDAVTASTSVVALGGSGPSSRGWGRERA
jgi:hypothetical protein